MSRQRFVSLLVAAVIAISAALYLTSRRNAQPVEQGAALLPALAAELNTVTALDIRRGSATPTVTVHEHDGHWTVAQRGDYPADVSKVRKLVLALSDAKIIEQKTSNPANYPVIGVEDPSLPGAAGAEISVTAKDGKHAVIVGKTSAGGNFARRAGEKTSYLVEPGISFESEARYWIEPQLIDIAAADIQSIEVKPATGPAYTVRREAVASAAAKASAPAKAPAPGAATGTGSANFVLEGTPRGRKALDSASLAPSPTTYGALTADDVGPAADVDFTKAAQATITLSGGNVITLSGATSGDKHWITLKTTKDETVNAKTAGRAFEIAAYRFDALFRPVEQLLVPKPPPPDAHKAASKPEPKPKP
jgi:hypothetical protein